MSISDKISLLIIFLIDVHSFFNNSICSVSRVLTPVNCFSRLLILDKTSMSSSLEMPSGLREDRGCSEFTAVAVAVTFEITTAGASDGEEDGYDRGNNGVLGVDTSTTIAVGPSGNALVLLSPRCCCDAIVMIVIMAMMKMMIKKMIISVIMRMIMIG